ncbi:MAG: DUF3822 family protein [Bacteroidetes bacterium]|nr:DUF3822 family protein [Bacteroidota bacterium]
MTHSVSHKLYIELNGNDLTLLTANKEAQIISIKNYNFIDEQLLDNILTELPDIYSEINLLLRRKNFITIPEQFYDEDIDKIYSLSYNLAEEDFLNIDKTDFGIGVVYQVDRVFAEKIKNKFSRVLLQNEVSLVLNKIFKTNINKSKIFITKNDEQLNIYIVNNGKLMLCNPYITKSNDDTFYFVMLAIEQLHLMPEETELIILGEPPNRKAIFDLFKNYINEINIWLEDYNCDSTVFNKDIIEKSYPLQLLVCG